MVVDGDGERGRARPRGRRRRHHRAAATPSRPASCAASPWAATACRPPDARLRRRRPGGGRPGLGPRRLRPGRRRRVRRTDARHTGPHEESMTPHDDRFEARAPITRRRFVAGTLVTGAAVAVRPRPRRPRPSTSHKPKHKPSTTSRTSTTHTADVAVVGAGLRRADGGPPDRRRGQVGDRARGPRPGRRAGAYSRSIGAGASDVANMGATFVGPTQTQILGLMARAGDRQVPHLLDRQAAVVRERQAHPLHGASSRRPATPRRSSSSGTVVLPEIDQMAQTVPLDAPWTAPNALGVGLDDRRDAGPSRTSPPPRARSSVRAGRQGRAVGGARATSRSCTSCSTSTPPEASSSWSTTPARAAPRTSASRAAPRGSRSRWPTASAASACLL